MAPVRNGQIAIAPSLGAWQKLRAELYWEKLWTWGPFCWIAQRLLSEIWIATETSDGSRGV